MSDSQVQEIPTVFVSEPSSHLKCLICCSVYNDPVINVGCGHTFCRKCATDSPKCPSDNSSIVTTQLVTNRLVVGQLEDLQIFCCHGFSWKDGTWEKVPGSCSTVLQIGSREEHEKTCPFAPLSCPNSDQCGTVRSKDLERHMLECVRTPCELKEFGCNYRGTLAQVGLHVKTCLYREGGTHTNGTLVQSIKAQEIVIRTLQVEKAALENRVSDLEGANTQMVSQSEKQNSLIQLLTQRLDHLTLRFNKLINVHQKRTISTSGSQLSLAETSVTPSVLNYTQSSLLSTSSLSSNKPSKNHEDWEMPFQFKCMGTYRGHRDVVWSMTTKKGKLYSGGADGIVKVWSLDELAKGCIDNINAHTGVIHSLVTWSGHLISGGDDLSIRLWDLDTYQMKGEIEKAHDNTVCAMVTIDDFLYSSSFSSIKVWDLKTLSMKANFTGMGHWVRALAVGHNKDKLYSSSHNAVHVWDIKDTYEKAATIEHEHGSVYALAVNRQYIVVGTSGSYEENIQLYDVNTNERLINLCGHIGTVTTLIISSSGRFMFSASHDSNIQVWSLEKLLPIHSLSRHQGSVNTLTLHGDFLLSGSEDREIKIFRYFQIH